MQGKDPRLDCTGADEESEDEDVGEKSSDSVNILFTSGSLLISPTGKFPSLSTGHTVLPRIDASMVGELVGHLMRNMQQAITRRAIGEAMERVE